jgi:uncharacterized membrane protein YkoI
MKRLQPAFIVLLVWAAFVCSAQQRKLNRELAHLPPVVRKAIRAKLGDARLDGIEKDIDDGEVVYDVEMVRDGKSRGFTVDDNGVLLDEEVFLPELSPAVQHTIQTKSANGTVDEINKSADDDDVSYDVEFARDGRTRDCTVGGDGALLEEQVFPGELPPGARQTILKETGSETLGEIDRAVGDGEMTYDVETTAAGKTRHFAVDAAGNLLDKDVSFPELPATVQDAIRKQNGADGQIHQCFDDGEVSYEVEVSGDRTLSFDPDGKLLSTDQDVRLADTPEAVQAQVKSLAGEGKCLAISKTIEDNETYYDVELETSGSDKNVSLAPDGRILPDEDDK